MLQYVGTDVVREKRPDFWIGFIADLLDLFDDEWDYVLIPDCRFPNEISVLSDRGFDVMHVNIERTNFDNGLSEEQKRHPSEIALDNASPDVTISNAGSLVDLTGEVLNFVQTLHEIEGEYADDSWYPRYFA